MSEEVKPSETNPTEAIWTAARGLAAAAEETTAMIAQIERERAEQKAEAIAIRRERIMATLLTGWLSDMEADAAKRNVAHARKVADAIMEAAQ